jgi:ferredoxin
LPSAAIIRKKRCIRDFTRSDDGGYSYVFRQPTTPEEEALCKEAMAGCPVEAIGNDGEG